jgi:hypothetical protein
MMRSFWTIALLGIALLPLTADDPVEKRADAQAPPINIQPRSRTSPTAAGETIPIAEQSFGQYNPGACPCL